MTLVLNDVHSQLNPSRPACIERPENLAALIVLVQQVKAQGGHISVAGSRHAMGGQQFSDGSVHIDMTGLKSVLAVDGVRGLLHIEAGADWNDTIQASHQIPHEGGHGWGIRQKQTGVDVVTLGGSISANAHGRGLMMQPLADDIEDLSLIDAQGELLLCNRAQNAELFALALGGYGLFGLIYSATLRLSPRQKLTRVVDIIDLDDAANAIYRRLDEGCLYGDFQFVIDRHDEAFLRRGVFACYKPCSAKEAQADVAADLAPEMWLQLLQLAYEDKSRAFKLYSQHYLASDGQQYWSDTMQLSTYIPSYVDFLESHKPASSEPRTKETLVIGEHYVPYAQLLSFMQQARAVFRLLDTEVIYGTIRVIQRDQHSFLPWAREDFACVIFNVRTSHDEAGALSSANTFKALIDACNALGGSFFLTYHRHASAAQVEKAYPKFRQWLALKLKYDAQELFSSTWYRHYRDAFGAHPELAA